MIERTCQLPTCDNRAAGSRRWCSSHLFWSKVTKSQGCWTWNGSIDPAGYGCLTIDKKPDRAHRVSYKWAHGDIPPGMFIDHVCGTRSCVNPDHLRLATPKQNGEHRTRWRSKSGVRGVYWVPRRGLWVATVRHNYELIHVGYFSKLEDAATAVEAKRREVFTHH